MNRNRYAPLLMFGLALALTTVAVATPSNAAHQLAIPYSYVGDGWDTVLVVSNISSETINPILAVRSGDITACTFLGELESGDIYVNTFGAITGWSTTPPIPGVFQVYVSANELGETDRPFGVAVAINNSIFGGFGFQQFKSEYAGDVTFFCILPATSL